MDPSVTTAKDRRQLLFVMVLSILVPLLDSIWGFTAGTLGGPVFDEGLHRVGRVIGALHFSSLYLCVMVRLLVSDRHRIIRRLPLPALLFLLVLGAVAMGFFVHLRDREFIALGPISMEGFSLRQVGSGVISVIPAMAMVMVLSPVLIPSSYIQRLGDIFGQGVRTGHDTFDEYLSYRHRKKVRSEQRKEVIPKEYLPKPSSGQVDTVASKGVLPEVDENPPDVLLVEDDLNCATLVLKFCKKIKLDCLHVEDLHSAKEAYARYAPHLRLVLLDNFVRVGEDYQEGDAKTGSEWAKELNQAFQEKKRHFHIAILSGHTHLLQELAQEADLVLQKPWEPQALFRYLKDNDVV